MKTRNSTIRLSKGGFMHIYYGNVSRVRLLKASKQMSSW